MQASYDAIVVGRASGAGSCRRARPGARPHRGQYNVLDEHAGALHPRWADWLGTYEQLNASGVFDPPFTDRIGISRRPR